MSNIGMEVTVSVIPDGQLERNSVRKITGLNKATDVTLKPRRDRFAQSYQCERHSQRQFSWPSERSRSRCRTRTTLRVVQTWSFLRARIIKAHPAARSNAKGTDVAMEELTIAYERLEME